MMSKWTADEKRDPKKLDLEGFLGLFGFFLEIRLDLTEAILLKGRSLQRKYTFFV